MLVASLSFTAKAQKVVQGQFSVKGILLDSLSNEGELYSTIRISLKNNPAKPVKLAVTGADGRFDERLAVPGTYLIHFTSVGKAPVQKEFSISTNRKNVDLGKILIAESTEMLKGVEVVAQKPLVKAEIDKVIRSFQDKIKRDTEVYTKAIESNGLRNRELQGQIESLTLRLQRSKHTLRKQNEVIKKLDLTLDKMIASSD